MNAKSLVALLFGLRSPVNRRTYALVGFGLMALKYCIDSTLAAVFAERIIPPLSYLNPILNERLVALGSHPDWLPVVMSVLSLPFVWVGVTMSAKRAADAGMKLGVALLFFVPIVNLFLILALCMAPTRKRTDAFAPALKASRSHVQAALVSVATCVGLGLLTAGSSIYWAETYGSTLFFGAPFVMGVASGYFFNRADLQSQRATIAMSVLGVTLTGGSLLIFALEGVLCLAMAAMLAYPLAILGSLFGRALVRTEKSQRSAGAIMIAWPILLLAPWDTPVEFPLRNTVSSIVIDAPPEAVWPHVVGFTDLPPPSEWLLKTGIACPLRARIVGEGVGAIRYCEFTTGPFIEPVTAWEPPHRLAFDVTSQPPSMKEWSPYEVVHAPHLLGGLQSERGEFRLERLSGGRTRLVGTTWYRIKMSPNPYWGFFADTVIHTIHERVLKHVERLSVAAAVQESTL